MQLSHCPGRRPGFRPLAWELRDESSTYSRPWLAGLYPLALVLVVVPLMDAVTRTLPVRPDERDGGSDPSGWC
jgi:hypothetical protein